MYDITEFQIVPHSDSRYLQIYSTYSYKTWLYSLHCTTCPCSLFTLYVGMSISVCAPYLVPLLYLSPLATTCLFSISAMTWPSKSEMEKNFQTQSISEGSEFIESK